MLTQASYEYYIFILEFHYLFQSALESGNLKVSL